MSSRRARWPRLEVGALPLRPIVAPSALRVSGWRRRFRGALLKPFREDTMSIAANFLIASGYTGQTTEVLALPTDTAPFERVVGVPLKSYVSLSWTYYFKK